jgi:hypothetical protein
MSSFGVNHCRSTMASVVASETTFSRVIGVAGKRSHDPLLLDCSLARNEGLVIPIANMITGVTHQHVTIAILVAQEDHFSRWKCLICRLCGS